MKSATIVSIVMICIFHTPVHSQPSTKKQVNVIRKFLSVVRDSSLTHEQIMKTFVVDGNYFKDARAKQIADQYLTDTRNTLRRDSITRIIPYAGNERLFAVEGVNELNEGGAGRKKMKFILATSDDRKYPVNEKYLYVVSLLTRVGGAPEEFTLFILLNAQNKVESFAGISMGDTTSLMRF